MNVGHLNKIYVRRLKNLELSQGGSYLWVNTQILGQFQNILEKIGHLWYTQIFKQKFLTTPEFSLEEHKICFGRKINCLTKSLKLFFQLEGNDTAKSKCDESHCLKKGRFICDASLTGDRIISFSTLNYAEVSQDQPF